MQKKTKHGGSMVFFSCLLLAFLLFLPYLMVDHGYFIYYGDYNVQQIPFYQLAHDAIRSGQTGWNWNTDLGADFLGSYSFYLLGSPFFWLTIPFPNEMVPYLMAPLLMLKFAFCGFTSYLWLKTLVQKTNTAILGGILYAFCGFNLYNVFFNHFLEPVILFPLLLLALDRAVLQQKRGELALALAASAIVNYYFFFGQAVFLLLYYAVNFLGKRYPFRVRTFLWLAAEVVIGVLFSAFLLLPSLAAIIGNSRVENFYLGMRMILFPNEERYGLILESLFLIPDIPAKANLFSDSNAKWASVSLYLPLFTASGAAVYWKEQKESWVKKLLLLCGVMAVVPVLNSVFSAFNANYYARWFYMPTLLLVLCTLTVLETPQWNTAFGIRFVSIGCGIFALIGLLPKKTADNCIAWFQMPTDPFLFWETMAVALLSVLILLLLRLFPRESKKYRVLLAAGLSVVILLSGNIIFLAGREMAHENVYEEIVTEGIEAKPFVGEEDVFYRIDFHDDAPDNLGMFWEKPTIQCFHSIVPPSVMEFYESIGVDRSVASRPSADYAALRALTSVKYRMIPEEGDGSADIPGFGYHSTQNDYLMFENRLFVPMGFTYDYYVSESQWEEYEMSNRDELLLKAVFLDRETEEAVGHLLQKLPFAEYPKLTDDDYAKNCLERAEIAADTFAVTEDGFEASIRLPQENLVFFSVPYEKGWSAEVNGKEADIYRVNVGFMAVVCEAGENEITFTYKTPGKQAGLYLSLLGLLLFAGMMAPVLINRKRTHHET